MGKEKTSETSEKKKKEKEQEVILKDAKNLYHGIKLWCIFCVKMARTTTKRVIRPQLTRM